VPEEVIQRWVQFLMSEKSRFLTAVRIGVQRLAGTGFKKGRERRHKHGKIDERTQTFVDSKVCNNGGG
jgi:hypothetical protein